jgi:hypothetical protein
MQNKNLVLLYRDMIEKANEAKNGKSFYVHILKPLDCNPI